jgi:flagellar motor switch protein FliM
MIPTIDSAQLQGMLSMIRSIPRAPRSSDDKAVRPFDFRRSKGTDSDRFTVVREILQRFVTDFGASIVDYLRADGHVRLLSIEQTVFADFASAVSKTAYLAAFQLLPADVPFLFQTDLAVAYPIIDLILGGPGTKLEEIRPLTEIERQVFDTICNFICTGLRKASAPVVQADVRITGVCTPNRLKSFLPDRETILLANMEIRLGTTQGTMALAFPSAGFDFLTPQVSKPPQPKRLIAEADRLEVKRLAMEIGFESELVLPPSSIKIRELLSLEAGSVLTLARPASGPARLQIAGKPIFSAFPVRKDQRRGAQIDKRAELGRNSHE